MAAAAPKLAGAFTRFAGFAGDVGSGLTDTQRLAFLSAASKPAVIKTLIKANPDAFLPIFKMMDQVDIDLIKASLDAPTVAKLRKAVTDSGDAALASKMFPDGATVRTVLTIGAGAGLIAYLDDKFKDEEKDYKNCMAGCVPHNWDVYKQGGVKASELKYSTVETLPEYQITPIENQPYCVSPNKKCEEYCKPKCKEETKADIPFMDAPGRFLNKGAEGAGGLLNGLFGGLLDGLGLDTSTIGYASSASSSMCCLFVVLMLYQQFK